ncbi:MAG: FadR family transcriptional regulator [Acidimicrobiia bacterium]|nr:FadR family transcriptional regulator [Acidimicrobiia bacterium]
MADDTPTDTSTSPSERRALDEQIVTAIIEAVIGGEYPPGKPLPPERELAEHLGVNRTSLRQALARLEQIGLIASRQGSGNLVRDPTGLTDPAVVRAMAHQLDVGFFAELVEVRAVIGTAIGRMAAERATGDDLGALHAATAAVATAPGPAELQSAELEYFEVLVTAAHNRAISLLLRWVRSAYGDASEVFVGAFEDHDAVLAGVERLTSAVARHDPAAAEAAMAQYLDDSGGRLLRSVGIGGN